MFVVIFVMIGVSVRKESAVAVQPASNLFSTKNSYNASLELWADQPTETAEDEQITACCQPIQVTGYRSLLLAPQCTGSRLLIWWRSYLLLTVKARGVNLTPKSGGGSIFSPLSSLLPSPLLSCPPVLLFPVFPFPPIPFPFPTLPQCSYRGPGESCKVHRKRILRLFLAQKTCLVVVCFILFYGKKVGGSRIAEPRGPKIWWGARAKRPNRSLHLW